MGVVLALPLALLFVLRLGQGAGRMRALADTAVIFAALTALGCELLSLFSAYAFWPLLCYWLAVCAGMVMLFRGRLAAGLARLRGFVRRPSLGGFEWFCVAVIAVFAGGALLSALVYPPTDYDSLVYHLPRVFFWMKNASVHNYATSGGRELFTGPFSEFCILQLQVLCGGRDIMANLVQFGAYLGCIAGLYGITRQLCGRRGPAMAAGALAATHTLAVLQASTTQADLFTVCWCVLAVYYVVWFIKNRPQGTAGMGWAVLLGLCVGAAVLSKNTAYMMLAPFAILFVACCAKQLKLKGIALYAALVVAGVLAMNAGFYTRNFLDLNGDILAYSVPNTSSDVNVTTWAPGVRIVILLVNFLINLASRSTFFNGFIEWVVVCAADTLNVNMADVLISTEVPFTTAYASQTSYTSASSPWQMLLVLAAGLFLLVLALRKKTKGTLALPYLVTCAASMLLLFLNIKWGAGNTRYALGGVMLALPLVPLAFGYIKSLPLRRVLATLLAFFILQYSGTAVLFNTFQPLLDAPALVADVRLTQPVGKVFYKTSRHLKRQELLFRHEGEDVDDIRLAAEAAGVRSIGHFNEGPYKADLGYYVAMASYPYLYLWRGAEYDVRNVNTEYCADLEDPVFAPDALFIIVERMETPAEYVVEYHGRQYRCAAFVNNLQYGAVDMLLLYQPPALDGSYAAPADRVLQR